MPFSGDLEPNRQNIVCLSGQKRDFEACLLYRDEYFMKIWKKYKHIGGLFLSYVVRKALSDRFEIILRDLSISV